MASCVLTNVIITDGRYRITFADGVEFEFNSLADIRSWLQDVDTIENTRKCCVAYLKARSADLSNVANVRNKTFTFDLSLSSPIRVQ